MQEVGYAALQVIPSFDGFDSKLTAGTRGPLARAGKSGGKVFGDSAGKSIGTSFLTHVKQAAALGGSLLVGAAVKNFLGDSISEARESQKVGALTVSTLKATGHAAGVTNQEVGKLAHTLSRKAAIDDEQIQAGENVLLNYKNVRNEVGKGNDVFTKATARAVDLAAALAGQKGGTPDVAAASKIVGKALDDPVKGMSALRKAGVDFSAQQIANVKNLVATGKTMDAQKVILGALTDRYKGAAASQATEGAKVGVAWKNVEEQVGNAILPLIDDIERAILTKGMPVLRHWAHDFQRDGVPAIRDFAKKAEPLANQILPALATGLRDTRDMLEDAAPYAERIVKAFNQLPGGAQKAIVAGAGVAYLGKKVLPTKATSSLLGLVTKTKPLPVYVVNEGFGLPGGGKGGVVGDVEKGGAAVAGASAGTIAGAALLAFGSVGFGANRLGRYLGSRQPVDDPAKNAAYRQKLAGQGPGNGGVIVQSFDPLTGLPSVTVLPQLIKQVDVLKGKAGAVHLQLNGYDDAKQQLIHLRQVAAEPINVQVVLRGVGKAETALGQAAGALGGFLGGTTTATTPRAAGGVNFYGGVTVHGDTYGRVMSEIQRKAQRAQLDGVRSTR